MTESAHHPLIRLPLGAAHWRRATQRRYARAAERHRELVVLHALAGQARYLIEGQVVTLRPGALLWALAGQAHMLLSDSADFDMWVFLISDRILPGDGGEDLPPFRAAAYPGGLAPRVLPSVATAELDAIALGIEAVETPALQAAAYAYWLTRAWAHWRAAPEGRGRAVHPAVDRAARALQADPGLSAAALARTAGLSAGRLGQVFRDQTGQSLGAFRSETRLARVDAQLAANPRCDLLTAALDAGFGSYSQFYRVFRAVRGTAPRAHYRLDAKDNGAAHGMRGPEDRHRSV